ncbi:HNH endonuclease, partial [Mycobacterium hubeiense]|uniref:HNH endonuclease n=1 Tax=Mycobacterium hubeiense TaxID=1867256 RepID=UPI000C7F6188
NDADIVIESDAQHGALSEWRATLIVRESACLSVADRRALDAEMCADLANLEGKGDKRIAAAAKEIACRLDTQAVVDRAAKAEADRRVGIRPAPDAMVWVSALLPVAQGVGVYAALKRAADTTFDERSRGQVMADTLVQRVTGRPAGTPEPVAVNLVVTDQTLLGGDNSAAIVDGYGPIPAEVARRLVGGAVADEGSRATLRRLYAHPTSGALVAMESRSRLFPKGLARFIGLRDQTCRTPYCDAPIRHRDHAQPRSRGGPTSAANGLGECERCNYVKEAPGWRVRAGTDDNGAHTAQFVTPTGATYRSTAPPLPGAPLITISEVELKIGIALTELHAA